MDQVPRDQLRLAVPSPVPYDGRGCRFPGCGAKELVDVHHVRFRSRGGSGNPDNLLELCWFHHRLVHEGGWKLRLDDSGHVVVTNPAGNVIPTSRATRGTSVGILDRNVRAGIDVRADTIRPHWYGDPLDLDHVTSALWCADHRPHDSN